MKYYVDKQGNYLGGYEYFKNGKEAKHPDVPKNANEVSAPPENAMQKWTGNGWGAKPAEEQLPTRGTGPLTQPEIEYIRNKLGL